MSLTPEGSFLPEHPGTLWVSGPVHSDNTSIRVATEVGRASPAPTRRYP
jgi:hypothetical protein